MAAQSGRNGKILKASPFRSSYRTSNGAPPHTMLFWNSFRYANMKDHPNIVLPAVWRTILTHYGVCAVLHVYNRARGTRSPIEQAYILPSVYTSSYIFPCAYIHIKQICFHAHMESHQAHNKPWHNLGRITDQRAILERVFVRIHGYKEEHA